MQQIFFDKLSVSKIKSLLMQHGEMRFVIDMGNELGDNKGVMYAAIASEAIHSVIKNNFGIDYGDCMIDGYLQLKDDKYSYYVSNRHRLERHEVDQNYWLNAMCDRGFLPSSRAFDFVW